MATVTSLTAERMLAIEASSVVSGVVNGAGRLVLSTHDGATQDAGNVVGPTGPPGPVSWASIPDKPLVFPALTQNSLTTANVATDFPLGISTLLINPEANSPIPSLYGTLTTVRSYGSGGGAIQYWNSYQTTDNSVYYRQWFYLATAWGPWSSSTTPPGVVEEFAGTVVPPGYVWARGQAELRSLYPRLFAVIGTTFGAGNGSTTFNVPNRTGRVAVGYDSTQAEFNALGGTGGEKTHILTLAEIAAHAHTQAAHTHVFTPNANFHTFRWGAGDGVNVYIAGVNATSGTPPSNELSTVQSALTNSTDSKTPVINNSGGGGAHNNLQPYLTINYIIKV